LKFARHHSHVVLGLKIDPETRLHAEVNPQTQGGVGRDGPLTGVMGVRFQLNSADKSFDCNEWTSAGMYEKSGIKWQRLTQLGAFTMSLNISLPAELENRVRDHVASGMYGSASEVIREALRLFEAYQTAQVTSFASLQADIALGMADVQAGRVGPVDMTTIEEQGRAVLRAKKGAA
jgi:antitoxin ParD1/3/4